MASSAGGSIFLSFAKEDRHGPETQGVYQASRGGGHGGDQGLTDLLNRALAAASSKGLFRDESGIEYGPCVTNPEKILCVGLNYAKHIREVGQQIPKLPILFNKFNNALNPHQGHGCDEDRKTRRDAVRRGLKESLLSARLGMRRILF